MDYSVVKSRKIWFLNKRKYSEKLTRCDLSHKDSKDYISRVNMYPVTNSYHLPELEHNYVHRKMVKICTKYKLQR